MRQLPENGSLSRPVLALAYVAAAIGLAGCGAKPEPARAATPNLPAARVRISTVEVKPRAAVEEVVGTVRAKLQATLEARLSGRIDKLPVALGQAVKAGDLLAHLDAPELAARLEPAAATAEEARRDWERVSGLLERQAATRADSDAADARYRRAKGEVAEARAMIGYTEVLAPFDAVVTRKWVEVGDQATPGKPLISLEDPSALELEADVPEGIGSAIHPGARLTCRVEGVAGDLAGTVGEIAPAADPASRTLRVKLRLPQQAGLKSGQFARLAVPIGESRSLRVPASAVVLRGQLEIVFAVADRRAQMRLVKTGARVGDEVEVLSGLVAGDRVATDGAAGLIDGQPLEAQ